MDNVSGHKALHLYLNKGCAQCYTAPVIAPRLELRPLRQNPDDERVFQALLESAPEYTRRVTGDLATPSTQAQENLAALPPGTRPDQKHVLAIFDRATGDAIGCIDLIHGFPDPSSAFLGLLLISERNQRYGWGRKSYEAIEELVRSWPEVRRIRLAYVSTNNEVAGFWSRMGFRETGERKPYIHGSMTAESIVMEKALA